MAASGASKQTQLANEIAGSVHSALSSEFEKLGANNAQLTVLVQQVLARLEMLETTTGVAPKRAVRGAGPAGAKKTAGAAAGGSKKTAAGSEVKKVTNALLFFRYALGHDLEDMRETYVTDEVCLEAEKDDSMAKKDRKKDEYGYYSTLGAYLWKNGLTDDDKKTVRAAYGTWKESAAREDGEQQLEEDGEPAEE
jgi:hypothetical protein